MMLMTAREEDRVGQVDQGLQRQQGARDGEAV